MRIEGKLTRWNDDRGFGFITPLHGGQEIFVHISAFPKDGVRPSIGEKLSFEIETDVSGKKQAKYVFCPERPAVKSPSPAPSRRPVSYQRKERPGFFARAIPLLVVVGLGVYGYNEYNRRAAPSPQNFAMPEAQASSQRYTCDGRTHCSQMTSCAEATYFLRNCPGVKMDGNNDGVPCEQQWCASGFAK